MERNPPGWKSRFLTLAIGQTVSLVGSSAVQFALIWWLASETGSPLMLSLAGLVALLPQALLGPFAGIWIDRLKRKTVIIAADLFIGTCAAVFAVLFLFLDVPYWSACVVLGLRSVGNVFHTPALNAAMPMIVPENELVRVNGWTQFYQSGAFMLGPVLGAALYAALPLPVILLSDLVGAAAACICTAAIKIPDPKRQASEKVRYFSELKEGVRAVLCDKRLTVLLLAATASMLFYLPLSSLYPLMTSEHFSATAWHASAIELVYAAGMMASAVLISLRGEIRRKLLAAHLGLMLMGVSALLCGLLPRQMTWFLTFAVLCAVMGAAGNLYGIPVMAYMQQTIPLEAQGRAFSLVGSLMSLAMPLGLLIAGPVSEREGVDAWFFISGIAVLVITLVSLAAMGRAGEKGER